MVVVKKSKIFKKKLLAKHFDSFANMWAKIRKPSNLTKVDGAEHKADRAKLKGWSIYI